MPYTLAFPIQLPVTGIITNAANIETPLEFEVHDVTGSLQALVSGTYTVEIRDQAGALVATLNWTAAGRQRVTVDPLHRIPDSGALRFDVTGVGVGAVGPYVTVWARAG